LSTFRFPSLAFLESPFMNTLSFAIDHLGAIISKELQGKRVAVLCHPASVDRHMTHLLTRLRLGGVEPALLFGPEHGFDGGAQDMIAVEDGVANAGGSTTRIRSLYGPEFSDLSPKTEDFHGIDVLVIDLQDIGSRYYTFIWTAVLAAEVAWRCGVRVVVLDRPNPLGSNVLEGRMQGVPYCSFVGLYPLPIRHGLSLGEVVAWRHGAVRAPAELLRVYGGPGASDYPDLAALYENHNERPWVLPSPNMPTWRTAWVYPGGCLLEGTNLSEGRGTTRPFELVGAPWLVGETLARDLTELSLGDVVFRPCSFLPTFQKHAGQTCYGVQVHPTGPAFSPVRVYVALVALAHRQNPAKFAFRTDRYEYVDTIPAFDLLTGCDTARTNILSGSGSVRDLIEFVAEVPADQISQVRVIRGSCVRTSF
jgi:uncharacterized protein YbbC (DUF1343 family)